MSDNTSSSPSPPQPTSSPSPAPSDQPSDDAYLGSDEPDTTTINTSSDASDDDNPSLLGDITDEFDDDYSYHPPPRLIRAEAVLAHRTSRILLVIESLVDSLNHQAILRTAEALGVQNVWLVDSGMRKGYTLPGGVRVVPTVTQGSSKWLTLRAFDKTEECIEALRQDGREIWSTYLGPTATQLTKEHIPDLPARLAIVMGRELDGVSPAFLKASDRLVFLPMFGYTESFNVSVATALTLQRLFDICPQARGQMDAEEKREVRKLWYGRLACRTERREAFMRWVEAGERGELVWGEEDLRPKEEGRVPRISRSQRRRVAESGEREIIVNPGQSPLQHTPTVASALATPSQSPQTEVVQNR